MGWMHHDAAERVELIDREPVAEPDPAGVMRRIAAEALILQDEAESVLTGIAHGDQLGTAAPRGGPLIRRFFALADELPACCTDPVQRQVRATLNTILIHHAMQVSTALDFLAVAWRSDRMARQLSRLGGLGEAGEVLETLYRQLTETP